MRVFLDTNVIVSAAATRGLCADVLREVLVRHELMVSKELLAEVRQVLQVKLGVPSSYVGELLGFLKESASLARPSRKVDLPLSDPKDVILLRAALGGRAHVFVTGDGEVLGLGALESMLIVSPRGFWELVRAAGDR